MPIAAPARWTRCCCDDKLAKDDDALRLMNGTGYAMANGSSLSTGTLSTFSGTAAFGGQLERRPGPNQ